MDKLLGIALMIGLIALAAVRVKKVYPLMGAPYYLTPLTITGAILLFLVFTFYKLRD